MPRHFQAAAAKFEQTWRQAEPPDHVLSEIVLHSAKKPIFLCAETLNKSTEGQLYSLSALYRGSAHKIMPAMENLQPKVVSFV